MLKTVQKALSCLALLAATAVVPVCADAQTQGTQAQRAANAQAAASVLKRFDAADARIAEGRRAGAITRGQATVLSRQLAQARRSLTSSSRRQGFVSAGELASYDRTIATVSTDLDRRGVVREYGSDGLVANNVPEVQKEFRYDCQNAPIAIAIPGDRLESALDQLRLATHCPVSGTALANGKRSRPVVGTMTPRAALTQMLNGTGLKANTLKGGFQITRARR